jgi:hypothetical protein
LHAPAQIQHLQILVTEATDGQKAFAGYLGIPKELQTLQSIFDILGDAHHPKITELPNAFVSRTGGV